MKEFVLKNILFICLKNFIIPLQILIFITTELTCELGLPVILQYWIDQKIGSDSHSVHFEPFLNQSRMVPNVNNWTPNLTRFCIAA